MEVNQMKLGRGRWKQTEGYDSSHSMLLNNGAHLLQNILDANILQSLKTD